MIATGHPADAGRCGSIVMRTVVREWPRSRAVGSIRAIRMRGMHFSLTAPTVAASVVNRADVHRLNRMMRRRADDGDGNTVVHDSAVVAIVIIDDCRLIINLCDLLLRQTVIAWVRFAEIADGHERETIRGQPETKAN